MMRSNIMLLGTSHIASQSIKEIRAVFGEFRPDIVAVELDAGRLYALTHKQKPGFSLSNIFRIGFAGYLFSIIGGFLQKKLGRIVGIDPGSDMLEAVRLARKSKLELALIDRNIQVTLNRFSRQLTWKEKFRMLGDVFLGIFFRRSQMKRYKLDKIDLSKVPDKEIIEHMIGQLKHRYPSVYKVLISERNHFMAGRLLRLESLRPDKKILAVVGAGHKKGMEKILNDGSDEPDYSFSYQL